MSLLTPNLGLVTPQATDSFSTATTASNWGIADANPGIYVCTSNSVPTFGPNDKGRMISVVDTDSLYSWDGTEWRGVNNKLLLTAQVLEGHEITLPVGGVLINQTVLCPYNRKILIALRSRVGVYSNNTSNLTFSLSLLGVTHRYYSAYSSESSGTGFTGHGDVHFDTISGLASPMNLPTSSTNFSQGTVPIVVGYTFDGALTDAYISYDLTVVLI